MMPKRGWITGTWETGEIYIGYCLIDPADSRKIMDKSIRFDWGHIGTGPSQLALALLAIFSSAEYSMNHFYEFTTDVISGLPQVDFEMPIEQVQDWICSHS